MAKLVVNPSTSQKREVSLPRTVLSIGRDPSNDLVLPDAMVSRRHAVVEWRGGQFFIRDCNSSNGSLVNGDRVSERGLRDGDLVAIGTARLLFRDDVVEDVPAKSESGEKIKGELDDLLDEIDEVLESNAEDFVKSYVQKGGE